MRANKTFLTVTALAFGMVSMPGAASADESPSTESSMPQSAFTTCHGSGLTSYCKTIQAGEIPCQTDRICLYTNANWSGMMVSWAEGNYHPNFATISCQSGSSSVSCPNGGWGFDDETSSWINNTDRLYCINWEARPGSTNNDMPPRTGGRYIGDVWNDKASALSNSGCLP
ncbi:peptidase inhibitor family I36 protein [Kibdelosporangium aridum]|uniref:peptidase inhibitor family I36 protein n=1 Tax=Kibdelosporangium aridum TaxID=2030 RepID=UPI000524B7E5